MGYAIRETRGRPVTVEAAFRRRQGDGASWEVRADGGGVLGPVAPTTVAFVPGEQVARAFLSIEERDFAFVGRHDVTWTWYARPGGTSGPWTALGSTAHRVYLVLAVPGDPWSPSFASPENPWTDLLDYSCAIADGAATARDATRAVVEAVYSDDRLKYDILEGRRRYFGFEFLLTLWIERVLRGHRTDVPFMESCPGKRWWNDWIVNCQDCGGSVTLMSTILGAATEYVEQTPFGFVNLIEPIGRGPTNNPFQGCRGQPIVSRDTPRQPFDYHAYAMLCGTRYDACMKAWVGGIARAALWLAWLLTVVATLGRVRPGWLLDRAEGWLVDLDGRTYDRLVLDPFVAGSTPIPGEPLPRRVRFL